MSNKLMRLEWINAHAVMTVIIYLRSKLLPVILYTAVCDLEMFYLQILFTYKSSIV